MPAQLPQLWLILEVDRRDLLIRSPGVSWNDIAGLEEPKRVLQENVILPLLMPDYFQGIRRPVKVLYPTLC